MNASVQGCLENIDYSYKAFGMSKGLVKYILEWAVKQGYENTGEISEDELRDLKNKYLTINK